MHDIPVPSSVGTKVFQATGAIGGNARAAGAGKGNIRDQTGQHGERTSHQDKWGVSYASCEANLMLEYLKTSWALAKILHTCAVGLHEQTRELLNVHGSWLLHHLPFKSTIWHSYNVCCFVSVFVCGVCVDRNRTVQYVLLEATKAPFHLYVRTRFLLISFSLPLHNSRTYYCSSQQDVRKWWGRRKQLSVS